jgi:hypothetical protein
MYCAGKPTMLGAALTPLPDRRGTRDCSSHTMVDVLRHFDMASLTRHTCTVAVSIYRLHDQPRVII